LIAVLVRRHASREKVGRSAKAGFVRKVSKIFQVVN